MHRASILQSHLKPEKPRSDFPLFPHATGRWAKKVRGKLRYFGKWTDDPKGKAALNLWLDQKDDLLAGRKPRDKLACRPSWLIYAIAFATVKEQQPDAGDITRRTFAEYFADCEVVVS